MNDQPAPSAPDPNSPDPNEVKAYLRRLLLTIAIGALVMIGATIYAWRTYGARLEDRPPLPSGTPPFVSTPAATR